MRNYIVRTTIFLLIALTAMLVINLFDNIDKQTSSNHNIASLRHVQTMDHLDILFVGNSYCYSGINPQHFDSAGLNVYNAGLAAGGPFSYDLVVNDLIDAGSIRWDRISERIHGRQFGACHPPVHMLSF